MRDDFSQRFRQLQAPEPFTLQAIFPQVLEVDAATLTEIVRGYADELGEAAVEWHAIADHPELTNLVSGDGPPVTHLGLIQFAGHQIKIIQCDGPIPYGPMRSCVEPALMSPEDKQLAYSHTAHLLLYEYSQEPDPLERAVALASIAGVFACLGASTILNEAARAAIPAPDLIPEEEEDIFQTLRMLPIPYLYGGFVRMDVDTPTGCWVRSFANHRLGLPELAMYLPETSTAGAAFELFAGILGYLRTMQESLQAGDTADLGEAGKIQFREPTEPEWFLESEGAMLVIERLVN